MHEALVLKMVIIIFLIFLRKNAFAGNICIVLNIMGTQIY
jgi:hypothetical protein